MIQLSQSKNESFNIIFEDMMKYMANLLPENADISYQNPGVTILEMFSLLKDMQDYYLNYIGEEHHIKLANLLGVKIPLIVYSTVAIEFYDVLKSISVPKGYRVSAEDIVFETTEEIKLSTNIIEKIIIANKEADIAQSVYNMDINDAFENTFYPFAKTPRNGDGIYIGFKYDLKTNPINRIYIETSENNTLFKGFLPYGKLVCEYLTIEDSKIKWINLPIVDETCCFLTNGYIYIDEIKISMTMCSDRSNEFINTKETIDKMYWIRLTLYDNYFEKGPIIENIKINTVLAEQRQTHNNIILGSSNGVANQSFNLNIDGLDEDSLEIEVKENNNETITLSKWSKIDNLLYSNPYGKHYMIENREIIFGNNEYGDIPKKGIDNIIIRKCIASLGSLGNVKKNEVKDIISDKLYKAHNISDSRYGQNKKKIEEILNDIKIDANKNYKLVTLEDYENIVKQMPVLDIDKVKAIYNEDYPETISLAVKPNSSSALPTINKCYIKNILIYLEQYRIITTNIEIMPPKYYGLNIIAEIVAKPLEFNAEDAIKNELKKIFATKDETCSNMVSFFGETISYSKLLGNISLLPSVLKVKTLKISCDTNISTSNNNDIILPYYGLAYLKDVHINILFS